MKRTLVGLVVGIAIGMMVGAPASFAGYYYSVAEFLELRGNTNGESFMLGYVSGVHDTLAGFYPVSSHKLGDIKRSVIEEMLGDPALRNQPAYFAVVRTLIKSQLIKEEDLIRVFPEPLRPASPPKSESDT